MILITGAGGKTGRAIIQELVRLGEPVRGIVKNERYAERIRTLGAEAVIGDMLNMDDIRRAAAGARAIYHIAPNVNPDEVEFGKTAIAAARAEGVERFVFHSLCHSQIEALPNHWWKLRVEEKIKESGLNFTILQPTPYMQNVLGQWQNIIERGVYEIPYQPTTKLGMVDLADLAEVAAKVLTTEKTYDWATYELAGPQILTQNDILQTIRQVTGRDIRLEIISREDWCERARKGGMPESAVEMFFKMFGFMEEFGFWGNPGVLEWLLGRKPKRFEEWFRGMWEDSRLA